MGVPAGSSRHLVGIRTDDMVKCIAYACISLYVMRRDSGAVEVDEKCQKEILVPRQKHLLSIKKK